VHGANAFMTGSSNSSFDTKSCACAFVPLLAGIIFLLAAYVCRLVTDINGCIIEIGYELRTGICWLTTESSGMQ